MRRIEAIETRIKAIYDSPARIMGDKGAAALAAPLEELLPPVMDRLNEMQAKTSASIHARACG